MRWSVRERSIKKALLDSIEGHGVSAGELAEWLWEEFGIRVRPEWPRVRRAVLSSADIEARDLAVFMIEKGLTPDEGLWDARPAIRLRGANEPSEDSEGERDGG